MGDINLALRALVYKEIETDFKLLDKYISGLKSYDTALKDLDEKGLVTEINYNGGLFRIYHHGIMGIVEDVLGRPVLINKFKLNLSEFEHKYDLRNEISEDEILTLKDIERLI